MALENVVLMVILVQQLETIPDTFHSEILEGKEMSSVTVVRNAIWA